MKIIMKTNNVLSIQQIKEITKLSEITLSLDINKKEDKYKEI